MMQLAASPVCWCDFSDGNHAINCPLRPSITTHPTPYFIPIQPFLGWICPRCGAGVSPQTTNCPCNQVTVTITWSQGH